MISRRIFGALAALCLGWLLLGVGADPAAASCAAPCTKAQIATDITTNWPDNTVGGITPALLRSTVLELVNSYLDANGSSSLSCAAHQWISAIPTLSSITCAQPAITDVSGLGTGVATALAVNTGSAGAFVLFGGALGTPSSGTLTNATGLPISTGVSGLGTGVAAALGNAVNAANGVLTFSLIGTSGATLPLLNTANTWSGAQTHNAPLTIGQDWYLTGATTPTTLSGDVNNYNPSGLATTNYLRINGGAANRNITGLTAGTAGRQLVITNVGTTNSLVLKNLSASSSAANQFNFGGDVTLTPSQSLTLIYDSTLSNWIGIGSFTSLGGTPTGTVTSITCGTGLSGGTITVSGTCAVSLTAVTNSLSGDVALNGSTYTDGPSVAQGTSGTWFASGTVTVNYTNSGTENVSCKLWDGTTVIASEQISIATTNNVGFSLSGILASPAANIRISCIGANATIKFNVTTNSKDSTLSAVRLN